MTPPAENGAGDGEGYGFPRPLTDAREGSGASRTSVSVDLRAFHTDPLNDPALNEGRHEHVWRVQIIFNGEPFRDARSLRAALVTLLQPYQGTDLPAELWSAEAIARLALTLGNADPIGCRVSRDWHEVEVWR